MDNLLICNLQDYLILIQSTLTLHFKPLAGPLFYLLFFLSFGRCVNSDLRADQCHVLEQTELLKVSHNPILNLWASISCISPSSSSLPLSSLSPPLPPLSLLDQLL